MPIIRARHDRRDKQCVAHLSLILLSAHSHPFVADQIRDLYVGDVCLRWALLKAVARDQVTPVRSGGGKWYWEVKLMTLPNYIAIGWVTREYRV